MEGDQVTGFQSICRDITDRKKAEEALKQSEDKYRNIIENIEEGYYETNLSGEISFCNAPLSRIFGYTRSELIGMSSRQLMDEITAKSIGETFRSVYSSGIAAGM